MATESDDVFTGRGSNTATDHPTSRKKPDLSDVIVKAYEYRDYARERNLAHYQMATKLSRHDRLLGIPVIITTSIVGTAIFVTLQEDTAVIWRVATGMLSVMAAVLAALQTFFNYSSDAQKHAAAALGYARLVRGMDRFLLECRGDNMVDRYVVLEGLNGLVKTLDEMEEKAPTLPHELWSKLRDVSAASQGPPN